MERRARDRTRDREHTVLAWPAPWRHAHVSHSVVTGLTLPTPPVAAAARSSPSLHPLSPPPCHAGSQHPPPLSLRNARIVLRALVSSVASPYFAPLDGGAAETFTWKADIFLSPFLSLSLFFISHASCTLRRPMHLHHRSAVTRCDDACSWGSIVYLKDRLHVTWK